MKTLKRLKLKQKRQIVVLLSDEEDDALRELAREEDRSVSGQVRYMLRPILFRYIDQRKLRNTKDAAEFKTSA